MDNAQKAIMIGVGLFITIVIISAVLLITNLGTGMIDQAKSKISSISDTLSNQVYSSYDGKTLTGAEFKIAYDQYTNSDIGVDVYKGGVSKATTGGLAFTFNAGTIPTRYTAGGITAQTVTVNSLKTTLAATITACSITDYSKVYSTVVRDPDTNKVVGIIFVVA